MLERLLDIEKDWFLAVNGTHFSWLDPVMLFFSGVWAWSPLVIVLIYFVLKRRKEFWSMLICTALTGALNGIVTSLIFKPFFTRFRPTSHPLFMDKVLKVNGFIANGDFGFISGHSTNAFAFATLSALVIGDRRYSAVIFIWALLMVYSRVYLGAHFITDVVPGAMAGALIGWGLYVFYGFLQKRFFNGVNKKITV
ncbi:MAG: phosphatase PAP2 family protein [Tannerella sp.]|jgi:undecaprenyl-diphosphatase|nr:phosphatase PAP2 family protein [Tannerella sp.]